MSRLLNSTVPSPNPASRSGVFATLLLSIVGCTSVTPSSQRPQGAIDLDDDTAAVTARAPEAALVEESERGTRRRSGSVERAALEDVLSAGPGVFLSGLSVVAHFHDGRFDGWLIESFWPGDERYADVDLLPGDIVQRVNGVRILRPEQMFDVWTALHKADEIIVAGVRSGEAFELRFAVEGPPTIPRP